MPYDKESGKKFDSPKEALAEALPEGTDAAEVMDKLTEMGYSLQPEVSAVGLAVELEAEPKAEEEAAKEEGEESVGEEEPAAADAPADVPADAPEEALEISMGVMGAPEPMSKKRDKVAEGLMDKFKKGMV